jgi:hypothetical protein
LASSLVFALVVVSIAWAITLAMLMFGRSGSKVTAELQEKISAADKARAHAETELDRKRKELEEQRAALTEAKDQLKQAKKKIFDQREADKTGHDLVKARESVERSATVQLEAVREELAGALAEIGRLKSELEMSRRRGSAPVSAAPEAKPEREQPQVQRVIRELSDADKEKMNRLEHQSAKDKAKAAELEREVKRLKVRVDTDRRVYTVTKGELELVKDKFRALEKRLNRTLLERDLVLRAIKGLEKKTGTAAERTELSAEEIAAADRDTEAKQQAEAKAEQQRAAEAAEVKEPTPEATPKEAAPVEGAAAPTESNVPRA